MATLISNASGNFTSSSTWALALIVNDSSAANSTVTTSYVGSSNFTVATSTCDGLAVKIASVSGSPTGTMSIELYNATAGASVAGTEVTVNVSDIPVGDSAANGGCGWIQTKFTGVAVAAATNYQVRIKTSSSSQVNLYSSSGTNWSLGVRSTTQQAPASGDNLYIQGEFTAAATSSTFTVTMDNTATTAFGIMTISNKGILENGTAASTNYYLKQTGIAIYTGGIHHVGTSGTRIPSTSTAVIEFNSAGAAGYGWDVYSGGTLHVYGNYKANWRTFMTADKAGGGSVTNITVASTADWEVSDDIAFASTTRTNSETERKVISSITNSTDFVLTAGLVNAHSGTGATAAEAVNLTRNVKIRGVSGSNTGYLYARTGSIIIVNSAQISAFGSSTTNKRGFSIGTTTGSFTMQYCVYRDCTLASSLGCNVTATSGSNINISDNAFYNINSYHILLASSSGTNVYNNNIMMLNTSQALFEFVSAASLSTITNNTAVSGSGIGFYWNNSSGSAVLTNFTDNIAHSNGSYGIQFGSYALGNASRLTVWRNSNYGVNFLNNNSSVINGGNSQVTERVIDGITAFGNNQGSVTFALCGWGTWLFKNMVLNAGTTLVSAVGFNFAGTEARVIDAIFFQDCDIGVTTTHSSYDIEFTSGQGIAYEVFLVMHNTRLGSTTEVYQDELSAGQFYTGVMSTKHDGVSGAIKNYRRYSTITLDTTIFKTAAPSMRVTPRNATFRGRTSTKVVPVASGGTVTVSAWLRQSSAGDGANYNGSGNARIVVRKNYALGITADTVLATYSVSNGTWEQLTGTTAAVTADGALEFYIECMGTVGWVNVDDWATTSTVDPTDFKYWLYALPVIGNSTSGGGGGSGGSWMSG